MPSTSQSGALAEDIAQAFYLDAGYRLLARNYRLPCGELDLVLVRGEELLIVEVKGRTQFQPDEAWSLRWRKKKRKLRRMARLFLARHPAAEEATRETRLEIAYVTQGRVSHRYEEDTFF